MDEKNGTLCLHFKSELMFLYSFFFILQKKKLQHIIPPGHFPNFEHINLGTRD